MSKKASKSWRTNIVAALGAVIIIVCLVLIYLNKATLTEAASAAGALAIVLNTVSSYLSKDSKATHSGKTIGGDEGDPAEEEEPGAGR